MIQGDRGLLWLAAWVSESFPIGQLTRRGYPGQLLLALRNMQFRSGVGCDSGTVTPSGTWYKTTCECKRNVIDFLKQ